MALILQKEGRMKIQALSLSLLLLFISNVNYSKELPLCTDKEIIFNVEYNFSSPTKNEQKKEIKTVEEALPEIWTPDQTMYDFLKIKFPASMSKDADKIKISFKYVFKKSESRPENFAGNQTSKNPIIYVAPFPLIVKKEKIGKAQTIKFLITINKKLFCQKELGLIDEEEEE